MKYYDLPPLTCSLINDLSSSIRVYVDDETHRTAMLRELEQLRSANLLLRDAAQSYEDQCMRLESRCSILTHEIEVADAHIVDLSNQIRELECDLITQSHN